ncbi:MAG: PCMD domain-containing protein [Muribaculaceae bacterium]|nr:PCMD domain-containing protein [Muribaculaceae bacterium]
MKYNILYIAVIGLATMFAGCSSDEFGSMAEGQGKLVLTPKISTEVSEVVVSRATDNKALLDKLNLALKNSRGETLHYWNDVTGIPWDKTGTSIVQTLNAGTYTIEGWTGNDTPTASFEPDDRYFKGEQKFEIIAGGETDVTLTCKIANTAVAVEYDRVDEVLKDYKIVVSSSSTFLTFGQSETRTGYFLLPADNKNLEYTITGTKNDGGQYSRTETITNAKPATKYTIKVSYSDPEPTGGSSITVSIDETPLVEEPHTVTFRTRPEITGRAIDADTQEPVDFSANDPFPVIKNEVGDIVLTARSSGQITSVELIHEGLSNLPEGTINLYGDDNASELRNQLAEAGISGKLEIDEDNKTTSFPITFASSLTDALEKGTYKFALRVKDEAYDLAEDETDRDIKSYEAVFTLIVTESGPGVMKVETTDEQKNTLFEDEIMMVGKTTGDVDEVGFFVRKVGEETPWEESQYVPGQVDEQSRSIKKNTKFSATVSGLEIGNVEYEYIPAFTFDGTRTPASDDNILTAQTGTAPQLPNAGFEEWCTNDGITFPSADIKSLFWDTGNTGAKKASAILTTKNTDESKIHSGKSSARLESKYANVIGIGKFAAGNVFIGKYLGTEGMDGVLGWGRGLHDRPFTSRPRALKGYVHYTPQTITDESDDCPDKTLVKGNMDKGIIYIALLTDKSASGKPDSYNNSQKFPVIVKTKSSDRNLFSEDDDNVIAYGEIIFTEATEGDNLVEFNIPLNYKKSIRPSNIMIVCAASKGGDYYVGGRGSVMYLDDLELVY